MSLNLFGLVHGLCFCFCFGLVYWQKVAKWIRSKRLGIVKGPYPEVTTNWVGKQNESRFFCWSPYLTFLVHLLIVKLIHFHQLLIFLSVFLSLFSSPHSSCIDCLFIEIVMSEKTAVQFVHRAKCASAFILLDLNKFKRVECLGFIIISIFGYVVDS